MPAMYDNEKLNSRFANHKQIKSKSTLLAGIQSNARLCSLFHLQTMVYSLIKEIHLLIDSSLNFAFI